MKRILATILTAFMALSLIGCSNGGGSTGTPSASTDSGETPAGGAASSSNTPADTFVFGIGGEPDYLDPAIIGDSVSGAVLENLYYPLFSIGEDGSTVNEACSSYDVSEDGLTYTFHLIENNYWSDGQQVVAGDYVYNMKRSVNYGSSDSYYSYFITDYVQGGEEYKDQGTDPADMTNLAISAPDDFTIVITLTHPLSYFVSMMTAPNFYPVREEYATVGDYTWAANEGLPYNGPFTLVSMDSTTEYVMKKNPNFAHADQVSIENLIAKVIEDQAAQLVAFQTGEIDMATSVSSDVTQMYTKDNGLVIAPSVINYNVRENCFGDTEALHDPRVRQALSYAIDRQAIVDVLDSGEAYYPLYGYIPVGLPGANGDFREEGGDIITYDPDKAIALLAEAGYDASNPLTLEYYYNSTTFHDTVAQVIQQQWAAVGITVNLKTGETRTFFDEVSDGLFQLARFAFSADYMDVTNYLDLSRPSNQKIHTNGDDTYEAMLDEAATLEGADRYAKLHEAEAYLVNEMAYVIPLIGYKAIYLLNPAAQGITYNPQGGQRLWYVTK